jgi:glycosyltransferase involved in cell wall biosynthesis
MISIIIPIYNQAAHLNNCLASIKNQTYTNYEIIVVNDGSTDEIISVMKKYDKIFGINLFYYEQKNQGANSARNYGAKLARGEYLIFCDADIIMKPEMLKEMNTTLKNSVEASYCYSSFLWGKKKFILEPFNLNRLKQMPYINTASLIKKEHFPGFDKNLKRFQDWDLWLTMSEQGHSGVWVNKILYQVNLSGQQSMSHWLPSLAYKFLPFLPAVKKYNLAKVIIVKKHNL